MDNIVLNLPENIELSSDIKGRAEAYVKIQRWGINYYIPITKEFKKIFKVKRKESRFIFESYKKEQTIYKFLRDIISSMYLQIREEVGEEIYGRLSQEISEGFNNLLENSLKKRIKEGIKLLTNENNQS